jgi:pyridinium-3,5-biscarboxylic acid mononucleotide sulfurtransferase
MEVDTKTEKLAQTIAELGRVAVAFSGGTDSSLLLAYAARVLGQERVLAVTADSSTLPRRELDEARAFASDLGVKLVIVATDEVHDERFAENPPDRCYYCKRELFEKMRVVAQGHGYHHLAYGATADDKGDFRPGMQAAEEAGAVAPLLVAGFSKEDVRRLSRELGLRTWDKPAMACLSSRFPYGSRITEAKLSRVEQAEELLRYDLGLREVRVRDHDTVARIEVGSQDFARLAEEEVRQRVVAHLKGLGYTYVALDLAGFRSGSMNEALGQPARPEKPDPA